MYFFKVIRPPGVNYPGEEDVVKVQNLQNYYKDYKGFPPKPYI